MKKNDFFNSCRARKKRHAEASYKNSHLQTVSFVLSISSRARCLNKTYSNHFKHNFTEAATKTVFENICSFFQEQPFYNFPGGFICFSNRQEFSRRASICLSVRRTDMNFSGSILFEQKQIFEEGLSKRHVFSRRFYLFVEQILIFPETLI